MFKKAYDTNKTHQRVSYATTNVEVQLVMWSMVDNIVAINILMFHILKKLEKSKMRVMPNELTINKLCEEKNWYLRGNP